MRALSNLLTRITAGAPLATLERVRADGWVFDANGVSSVTEVLPWAAAIAPNAEVTTHVISATSGIATTIALPTNLVPGVRHLFVLSNASGGAMGVVTWNAGYLMPAFSPPASGETVTVEFEVLANGTQLRQVGAAGGGSGGVQAVVTPAWGAAVTIDNTLGNVFNVIATTNAAYTYGAPAVNVPGQRITIRFLNSSGVTSGAGAFNAAYTLLGPAIGALANGVGYTISFVCLGASWIQDGPIAPILATQTDVVFGRSSAGAGPLEEIPFTAAARVAAALADVIGVRSSAKVTLTNAQVLALPTTPVQLVAAPGAGVVLVPVAVYYRAIIAGVVTNIDGAAVLQVTQNGLSLMTEVDQGAGSEVSILLANVATNQAMKGLSGYSQTPGGLENAALMIAADNAAAGDFTGGNAGNSLEVFLEYLALAVP